MPPSTRWTSADRPGWPQAICRRSGTRSSAPESAARLSRSPLRSWKSTGARGIAPLLGGSGIAAGGGGDALRFERRLARHSPRTRCPASNRRTRGCWRATLRASAATRPGSSDVRITPSSALSGLASGTAPSVAAPCSQQRGVDEGVVDGLEVVARGELAADRWIRRPRVSLGAATRVAPRRQRASGSRRSRGCARSPRSGLPRSRCRSAASAACTRQPSSTASTCKPSARRMRSTSASAMRTPSTRARRARRSVTDAGAGRCSVQHGFGDRARRAAGDLDDQPRRASRPPCRGSSGSTPRSKRCAASVCRPSLRRAADDRRRCEVRGFEEHVARRFGDARVVAAHDRRRARRCASARR